MSRSRVQFAEATPADDSAIRRLLRETAMRGAISLSLEREPNYFVDANVPRELKQTIIAREREKIVCVGSCVTRYLFVNGKPHRVGYLGGLRLAAANAGRFDIVRRGYQFFVELQSNNPADFYFTSIASDNVRARAFLERSAPGLPNYEFLADYATLIIPSRRGTVHAPSDSLHLKSDDARQFSPRWTDEQRPALKSLGLDSSDGVSFAGESAALWDQRRFKQTVIRGYSGWLRFVRPIINALGLEQLPKPGETLSNAVVCGLNSADPNVAIALLSALRASAAQRGINFISLGLSGGDPRLDPIGRRFRCRIYWSRIYLVHWPRIGGMATDLDSRPVCPELAFL